MNIYVVGYQGWESCGHMTLIHDQKYTEDELRAIYAECYREALQSKKDQGRLVPCGSSIPSAFKELKTAFANRGFKIAEDQAVATCYCDEEPFDVMEGVTLTNSMAKTNDAMFRVWSEFDLAE